MKVLYLHIQKKELTKTKKDMEYKELQKIAEDCQKNTKLKIVSISESYDKIILVDRNQNKQIFLLEIKVCGNFHEYTLTMTEQGQTFEIFKERELLRNKSQYEENIQIRVLKAMLAMQ